MGWENQAVQTITWVYVSEASLAGPSAEATVAEIAELARLRNRDLQVTGALLFTGCHFAQWLEGPEEAVAELKHSILNDSRHRLVTTIFHAPREARLFQGWSLTYSGASRYIGGFLDRVQLGQSAVPNEVREDLMRLFAEFAQFEGASGYSPPSSTAKRNSGPLQSISRSDPGRLL